ncbi:hypothetical protein [Anaerobiospirillum sp. NML120449]|uniref:hypothetical protein n=1 Tax=Anaerobiospirillum sp. NML120449 TaxID=2932817 RepID=UPI001FF3DB31|nr:hypothetical protein [Anaerobiospirillum sp. NML120449]MCK0526180.1 hypothetical protein [Anaerobiospirillum sp. NML120449]
MTRGDFLGAGVADKDSNIVQKIENAVFSSILCLLCPPDALCSVRAMKRQQLMQAPCCRQYSFVIVVEPFVSQVFFNEY